jgi:hypothetical protein
MTFVSGLSQNSNTEVSGRDARLGTCVGWISTAAWMAIVNTKRLRTMIVQGAHYILGSFEEDSDLRRWGLKLAERGGKMPRSERWLRSFESRRYCSIGCG